MLCNNCHQNEATVHLTQVIEGETTRAALCKTCAEPLTKGSITPQQLLDLVHDSGLREPFSEIAENDQRFSKEAFYFVRDGVNHAVKSLARKSYHVGPKELLNALRELAIERYGIKAREQLRSWGVTCCEDFGEIVFTLIDCGLFGKQPEDKKENFSDGYDFGAAFPVS